ncbi:type I secretion system permease/ATPase [Antarcticirhabdus aurantiaca]|uniref:Type I secretion system permease/ATPase n=1 Tax=Antarcticirhabdus aurantiaca TaxID=2606717 RepID=A0ACD4NKZ6_9HYPH|nr:type I secretion system permease/ATPase [Antarcticirhabdus aurantiaca]WAJ27464.1 type I secretion system permease/ATPase [Jeongeuplla avenae]
MNPVLSSPLLGIVRGFSYGYAALFAFGFFFPFLFIALSLVPMGIMERVGTSRNPSTLVTLIVIGVVLTVTYTLLEIVRGQVLERMGTVIDQRLTRVCFDAFNRGKAGGEGSPAQALADLQTVRRFLCGPSLSALIDAFWSPLFVAAMFVISAPFGFLILGLVAVSGLASLATHYGVARHLQAAQRCDMEASEFGLAVSRNAETLRVMGMLPWLTERWYALHKDGLGWRSAAQTRAARISLVPRMAQNGQMVIVYGVGGFLFLEGQIHIGVLLVVLMLMMRAQGPLQHVITNWNSFQSFALASRRLDALLRAVESAPRHLQLPIPQGALAVTRLIGGPGGMEKPVIQDVSFVLQPGRTLGIVGPSGAGKSCLTRLLVGIWKPRRGTIVFGEQDLSHWNQDDLGRFIGYVPQDVEFLPGTVAENIARFDPAATSERILAAVEDAGIHDIIRGLPNGYATRLGPGGHTLSGGQRQRVALARALYGNPRLVVLDEPNSNLDAGAEQMLGRTMRSLRDRGTAVIVVSHRVSLLGFCDDILVLNEGAVQALGTREQIFARLPRFRGQPTAPVIELERAGASAA